jgi:ArsR family transcriptional regulator
MRMPNKEINCIACGRILTAYDDKVQDGGKFYCIPCYKKAMTVSVNKVKGSMAPHTRRGVTTAKDADMLFECAWCNMIFTPDKLREDKSGKIHCPKCDTIIPIYIPAANRVNNMDNTKNEDYSATAQVFKCLSDPCRLKIIELLSNHELYVYQFVELTGLQYAAISYHLKILKDLGLIKYYERGNFMAYSLTNKGETVHEVIKKTKDLKDSKS